VAACRDVLGIEALAGYSDSGGALEASTTEASVDAGTPFLIQNMPAPQGRTLNAIWGSDADHFVAVGTSRVSYVYESGSFTRLGGSVEGDNFNAVWGTSSSDVYAVGTSTGAGGFVSHFDGTVWTDVFVAPAGLYGVWGTNGVVFAVGENGSLYDYGGPSRPWRLVMNLPANPDATPTPTSPILWSISGRNENDFGIASEGGRIFHWEPDAGGLAYYDLVGMATTSFRFAWQAPVSYTSLYLGSNFSGLWWFTAPDVPTDASFLPPGSGYAMASLSSDRKTAGADAMYIQGIWGMGSKVVAVGDGGRISVFDTTTSTTTQIPSPTSQGLGGVWGSSLDAVWIVGWNELIARGSLK
jgi:hypothetical protein